MTGGDTMQAPIPSPRKRSRIITIMGHAVIIGLFVWGLPSFQAESGLIHNTLSVGCIALLGISFDLYWIEFRRGKISDRSRSLERLIIALIGYAGALLGTIQQSFGHAFLPYVVVSTCACFCLIFFFLYQLFVVSKRQRKVNQ